MARKFADEGFLNIKPKRAMPKSKPRPAIAVVSMQSDDFVQVSSITSHRPASTLIGTTSSSVFGFTLTVVWCRVLPFAGRDEGVITF